MPGKGSGIMVYSHHPKNEICGDVREVATAATVAKGP